MPIQGLIQLRWESWRAFFCRSYIFSDEKAAYL